MIPGQNSEKRGKRRPRAADRVQDRFVQRSILLHSWVPQIWYICFQCWAREIIRMFCPPSANAEVRMADGAEKRTDIELLRRSAAGEEAAFNALYDRHQQAVYRFALYCT